MCVYSGIYYLLCLFVFCLFARKYICYSCCITPPLWTYVYKLLLNKNSLSLNILKHRFHLQNPLGKSVHLHYLNFPHPPYTSTGICSLSSCKYSQRLFFPPQLDIMIAANFVFSFASPIRPCFFCHSFSSLVRGNARPLGTGTSESILGTFANVTVVTARSSLFFSWVRACCRHVSQ